MAKKKEDTKKASKDTGKGKDDNTKGGKGGGKSEAKGAQSLNVRHILCEKHGKKEEALAKLREGVKFDEVAREFSEDKARQGMFFFLFFSFFGGAVDIWVCWEGRGCYSVSGGLSVSSTGHELAGQSDSSRNGRIHTLRDTLRSLEVHHHSLPQCHSSSVYNEHG